jgi:phage terminase large subunit-like protein
MNIIQALNDPKVFGAFFRAGTWDVWRVFLAALFGLPMTDDQLATYRRFTGRSTPPTAALHEAWLVIGRRGGKSFVLAVIAVFLACFRDWRPFLGPGEVGTVMIIAADRRQARVIMRYCLGLLQAVPMLAKLIEAQSRETIELRNRIVIEIHTASFRTTRGYTIVTALCDELAYWQSDETSAEPDVEVINALRPGMSTIPDAVLLCASSPYARRGAL